MTISKTKILLVVRWPGGGIRTFLRYVYRNFDPNLFQVTILSPNEKELEILKEDLKDLDVEIIRLSENPSSYELFKGIVKQVISGKYNLIHSQGFTAGICASLPAYAAGVPHMLTTHDILNGKMFEGILGKLRKNVMGLAFSLINTIHCVSHDSRDNVLANFPFLAKNTKRCVVYRNGIEVKRFIDAVPVDLRTELGVGKETYLIGFLGRFMSLKGFVYLIDAIEELSRNNNLPKEPLVISFGDGCFIREDKAQISKRGLDHFFRFLPFTPNVAGVIKALDVVVMPSLSEACGLLAMETLVAGTPLIATNCVGLREVVRDTPAYVIPPKNGIALAEGLELLMKRDRKKEFGMFTMEAASRFDVREQADKIRQLISEKAL